MFRSILEDRCSEILIEEDDPNNTVKSSHGDNGCLLGSYSVSKSWNWLIFLSTYRTSRTLKILSHPQRKVFSGQQFSSNQ